MKVKNRTPHLTWNGRGKRAYTTEFAAWLAAARMEEVTGQSFDVYLCRILDDFVVDDHWHCGHNQVKLRGLSVARQETMFLELGERVLAQIKAENRPNKTDALRSLRKRMRSVYRLAMRDWVPPKRILP